MRTPAGTMSFRAALVVAGLFAAAAAACLVVLLSQPDGIAALRSLPSNPWWFLYTDADPRGSLAALWRIASAVVASGIGIVAALRTHALYCKGGSPLLPFLILFFLSLSTEAFRVGTALLFAADSSIAAAIFLTRVLYWGRFIGLLSLLIAGLYCIELKYRKLGILVAAVALVSFAISAYIPIDRTVYLAQLTWKLGDEQGVWFVNLVIGVLVLATSAGAALTRRDNRFLWLALGMALFLASREMLFFSLSPWVLAGGLASLAAGAVVSLRTLSVLYRKAGEET